MKRWRIRTATAAVAAVVATLAMTGQAQAYDRGSCEQKLGAANVESAVQMRPGSSRVVFADGPFIAGALGTAVLCWAEDGGVAYIGRLFAETYGPSVVAKMDVTAYSASGSATTPIPYVVVGNWGANIQISEHLGMIPGPVTRVRFRFYENGVYKWQVTKWR